MPMLSWAPSGATLLAIAVAAIAPGFLLTAPFQRRTPAVGTAFRFVLSFVVGFAAYSFFTDFSIKALGANASGFFAAPILAAVALAFATRGTRTTGVSIAVEQRLEISAGQLALAAVFALLVIVQVVPVATAGGIHWGTPEMDWRSRLPTINAIARDGLPAANPFFDPDGATKLFFYYGGFLLPAGVVNLLRGEAINVLTVFVFCLGLSVAAFVMAFANAMFGERRAGWIAGGLTFITGLDLLPVLAMTFRGDPPASIEWWNPAQVTSMTAFPVWVPHHTIATLEVLAAHILLWQAQPNAETPPDWRRLPTIAVVLAAAMESSTYVGLLGFASLSLHGFLEFAWHRQPIARIMFPAGCVLIGGVLAVPFYHSLSKIDRYVGKSIAPILRPCPSEDELATSLTQTLKLPPDVNGRGDTANPPTISSTALFAVRAIGLVPQYFIEFGFFFVVAFWWRRAGFGCSDRSGLWRRLAAMCWAAVLIGSIFVSVRTWNCDLNWRILHAVQIALAAAGGGFLLLFFRSGPKRIDAFFLIAMIGIGAAGGLYDWTRTRTDYSRLNPDYAAKAERAARVSAVLNRQHPWSMRVQFEIGVNPFWIHHLRSAVVASDDNFNVWVYGVDKEQVRQVLAKLETTFKDNTSAEVRSKIFSELKVDVVIVDKESPLFTQDVTVAFGPNAKSIHEWPDCKVIALKAADASDARRGSSAK